MVNKTIVRFAAQHPTLFVRLIAREIAIALGRISFRDCWDFENYDRIWRGTEITLPDASKKEKQAIRILVYARAFHANHHISDYAGKVNLAPERLNALIKSCRFKNRAVGRVPLFRVNNHRTLDPDRYWIDFSEEVESWFENRT